MNAKYYTYRNLNRGKTFSTKYKGIVSYRFETAVLTDVELRVSEAGNRRARGTHKRNVHAFAVSTTPPSVSNTRNSNGLREIRYNPFKSNTFTVDDKPINAAKEVIFQDGKLFLVNE